MAKSGLTGDFSKLDALARKLDSAPKVLTIASKNMAQEALALVAEGFDQEKDPYGEGWEPLKDPTRGASLRTQKRQARQLERKRARQRQLVLNAGGRAVVARQIKSHKILQDTGRARKSWHKVRADADGFKIAPAVDYLGFHQNPKAEGRVARKMVPDPGNLPMKWRVRLTGVGREALRAHFRG
jgi:hypothetical protein